jgi:hypothetical protein
VGEPSSELHLEPISLRGRCSLDTTPSWEPILAALAGAQNGPASGESIGRADGGG